MIHKAVRKLSADVFTAVCIRFGSVSKVSWQREPPEVMTLTEGGIVTVKGAFPVGSWSLYVMTDAGIYLLVIEAVASNPL